MHLHANKYMYICVHVYVCVHTHTHTLTTQIKITPHSSILWNGLLSIFQKMSLLIFLLHLNFISSCLGARKLTSLYQPSPIAMTYHKGALLEGNLSCFNSLVRRIFPCSKIYYCWFSSPFEPTKKSTWFSLYNTTTLSLQTVAHNPNLYEKRWQRTDTCFHSKPVLW